MSKDKYLSILIFAPNGGFCVNYPTYHFCSTCSFENLGISLIYSSVLARYIQSHDLFRPVVHKQNYLMDHN